MKRIISLIVTVLLLINIMPFAALAANGDARNNAQDATVSFTISKATVDPGNTTQAVVYVDIANNPGFAGAELIIKYDENLTLLSVAKCDTFSQGFNLTFNKASGFVMLDNVSDVEGNGSLLTLTFSLNTIENKPTPEGNYDINLSVKSLFDENLDDIDSSVTPGKVIVSHDWTDATCTDPKTCKTCGATSGEASGHQAGEAVKENEQSATDDKLGSYDKVVYCTVCHTEISRETITGVAKIGETCYGTLTEALDAAKIGGEKVTLVTKTAEEILMVPAGVTLDLNGETIEVSTAVLAYGDIIDTAATAGGIQIEDDKIVHLQPGNTHMPLYDATYGCYRFYAYTVTVLQNESVGQNAVKFKFRLRLSSIKAYSLLADTANSGIEFKLNVTWTGMNEAVNSVRYVLADAKLEEYANAAYEQVDSGEKLAMTMTKTIEFTLSGLSILESGSTISATPTFTSVTTGVVAERTDKVDGYTSFTYVAPATVAE